MPWLPLTLRYACRALTREPGAAILAVVVLALGIAGATVTYSGLEAVVLRSLPFRDPEQLVDIRQTMRARRSRIGGGTNSVTSFEYVRVRQDVFEEVAAYESSQPILTSTDGAVERAPMWHVTANFFQVLGVQPLIGRAFAPAEDQRGAASTIVLSYAYWMARFGGDPRAVGRTLILDGEAAEIIGVMPRGLNYPRDTVAWRNMGTLPAPRVVRASPIPQGGHWIVGRLKPGITLDAARARLDAAWLDLERIHSDYEGWVCNLTPLRTSLIGTARTPLWLLFGASLLVLVIACANVANLLLVRAIARQQEVAVRLALGAGRTRIVSQFLAEALLIAVAAGALGLVVAVWTSGYVASFATRDIPALADLTLNGSVLALSIGVTLATGLVFGLVPGLWAASQRQFPGSRLGVTTWRSRIGDLSLVSQLAITVVLLGAAGLVSLSVARLLHVETGYEATDVVAVNLRLPRERYAGTPQLAAFGMQLEERLRANAALAGAAVTTSAPFETGTLGSVQVNDEPEIEKAPWAFISAVSRDYFGLLQIPLRRGRMLRFDGSDDNAILINETLARVYFPGRDPLGQRLTFNGRKHAVIVGIARDTREMALTRQPDPHIYQPFTAAPEAYVKILARPRGGDTAAAAATLRQIVRQVDPGLPIDKLTTVRALMMDSIARWRLVMVLLVTFAALALVISSTGTYALMAHNVARRRREMGIRIALGAGRGRILNLVVGRGLTLSAIGLVLGAAGVVAAGRALSAFLFDVPPYDPVVLAAAAGVLLTTVLAACWIPARRATRIDPASLLRAE
jgi:putative ABC transport system permease protein